MKLLWAVMIFAGIAAAQLPDGEGKAVTVKRCNACHGEENYVGMHLGKDGWEKVIEAMINRGAEGTDAEFDAINAYLTRHFGPKVNVNKAPVAEVGSALGMKPEVAQAVIAYRDKNGPFKSLDDLKQVPGVDAKELEVRKSAIEF